MQILARSALRRLYSIAATLFMLGIVASCARRSPLAYQQRRNNSATYLMWWSRHYQSQPHPNIISTVLAAGFRSGGVFFAARARAADLARPVIIRACITGNKSNAIILFIWAAPVPMIDGLMAREPGHKPWLVAMSSAAIQHDLRRSNIRLAYFDTAIFAPLPGSGGNKMRGGAPWRSVRRDPKDIELALSNRGKRVSAWVRPWVFSATHGGTVVVQLAKGSPKPLRD